MTSVLLAALCSVLVSVLLKLAPRLRFDIGQAVAWNYVAAGGLALLLLGPTPAALRDPATPWLVLAALGLLLPTIFLALGASVRHAGIVRTDAAQRLSLLVPLLAAFTLFGETPAPLKLAGCALGLVALACMVQRPGRAPTPGAGWRYPLLVFAGFGVIDVLFKRVAAAGIPLGTALTATFTLALVVAFAIQFARRARFTPRSALAGLLLGLLNFGNILFYLRAHRALPGQPSLVFASMNLGVVVLGALIGIVVFREQLGRIATVGLLLALAAIGLLTRG
ncbi:MAG: EamA/RhaT family transporter [Thermomonas sp.]|uniref:EamA family transporter n=1 Tax=Thermomonas sp. TaxID=1971895 RepID=UPI00260CBAFA|nr:EamA/RhaT family transporter [Thermomonas sp.]MCC7097414.1 EamA/RhaT family transporter [Thermomonas sp.]